MSDQATETPGVEDIEELGEARERRVHRRRTVLWPAQLLMKDYSFKCQVWNMSLRGARLKIEVPLAPGTEAALVVLGRTAVDGRVAWVEGELMGFEFLADTSYVRRIFADRLSVLGLSGA